MTAEPETDPSSERKFLASLVREVVDGQAVVTTLLSVVTALLLGALLLVLSEDATREPLTYLFARPGDFFAAVGTTVGDAYGALLRGAVGSPRALSETMVAATPLIFTALAFALPFRALIINIGGEGQFLAGAMAGGLVGFGITGLPLLVHLPLVLLAGFAGGALYGWIPGILKARTGAHEVIVTIMLNNVAFLLLNYLLLTQLFQNPGRADAISKAIAESGRLPGLFGSGFRIHAGLLVALAAAAAAWWLIERSTYGFQVKAVGFNPRAAQFAGMRPPTMYWSILLFAGAMAGLGGLTQLAGLPPFRLVDGFSAGLGFDGITVALLGRSRPIGIVGAALLFGALIAGGREMQVATQTSLDLVTVVQALVVLFIAAPALIRSLYRVRTAGRGFEASGGGWTA